jgi:hypothetical protein
VVHHRIDLFFDPCPLLDWLAIPEVPHSFFYHMFSYFTILLYVLLFLFNTNINLHIFILYFLIYSAIFQLFHCISTCSTCVEINRILDERHGVTRWCPQSIAKLVREHNCNFTMVFVGDIS